MDLSALLDVGLDVIEPGVIEPGVIEPDIVEPDIVEPDIVEPDIVEPDIGWLVAVEPEAVESDAAEPEIEASDVVEPGIEPGVVEPGIEPGVVEPGVIEPGVVEPGVIEPDIVEQDTIELTSLPAAADGDFPQSPERVGASLPISMTEMVNDVLAALRPVLQRYPGLVVGIWPPGRATEDLNEAIRFTLDAATGLSLRMSDTGSPDTGRAGDEHQDAGRPAPRSVAVELASLLRNGLSDR